MPTAPTFGVEPEALYKSELDKSNLVEIKGSQAADHTVTDEAGKKYTYKDPKNPMMKMKLLLKSYKLSSDSPKICFDKGVDLLYRLEKAGLSTDLPTSVE
jgi:hypothetical protein